LLEPQGNHSASSSCCVQADANGMPVNVDDLKGCSAATSTNTGGNGTTFRPGNTKPTIYSCEDFMNKRGTRFCTCESCKRNPANRNETSPPEVVK
jgi:hypothetical protein